MSAYPELSMHREFVLEDEQRLMLERDRRCRWTLATLVLVCVLVLLLGDAG